MNQVSISNTANASPILLRIVASFVIAITAIELSADLIRDSLDPLIESACVGCHDSATKTGLDFESLGDDLSDHSNFRQWERVFDRIQSGEMPPPSEDRPEKKLLSESLRILENGLLKASIHRQKTIGRVPSRRLTKREFGNSLRDLLLIDSDVTSGIPDEIESGTFDTVGINQRISAVHMESYLQAADEAIQTAINLRRDPYHEVKVDFSNLEQWHEKPINLGGSITRKLKFGDGVALFRDVDYLTPFTYRIPTAGQYRLTATIAAYQSKTPVTAKFIVKNQSGSATLVKAVDLQPREPETVVVNAFLKPGDIPYLTFDMEGVEPFTGIQTAGGSKHYKGRGLAILEQKFAGPVSESWPPPSTHALLKSLQWDGPEKGPFKVRSDQDQLEHVTAIVREIAPRLFRREISDDELRPYIDLAKPPIAEDRDFLDVVRVPLRSMMSSPQFLMFRGAPGKLDDYSLASRLSYFLWKGPPDSTLRELARQNKLSDSDVLARQVERMLSDKKSDRFVQDFLGQWLRLYKINATTPDDGLYPEYDELLANSIPEEPNLFFRELINENLSLANLIDSDFTFLNRRLAEHYGITGIQGQEFRRVELPKDSPRGGVLTQAAILKTTANGTTTSPVTRGNFVLTNFLGMPPSPPPPDVGSIEPDTRGKTTIREILNAHRDIESCNQCHREIDPPGFALESFDPIGGFRTYYRATGGQQSFNGFTVNLPPKRGPDVDASGVTADGKTFSGMDEFKSILMKQTDQIAKHFISKLIVYSTGGEIQFADRSEVDAIAQRTKKTSYRVRDIIHEIVKSEMFRHL